MKKEYIKPELDIKGYTQFENVFTACNKGNAKRGCLPDTMTLPSSDPSGSAAFNSNRSN